MQRDGGWRCRRRRGGGAVQGREEAATGPLRWGDMRDEARMGEGAAEEEEGTTKEMGKETVVATRMMPRHCSSLMLELTISGGQILGELGCLMFSFFLGLQGRCRNLKVGLSSPSSSSSRCRDSSTLSIGKGKNFSPWPHPACSSVWELKTTV